MVLHFLVEEIHDLQNLEDPETSEEHQCPSWNQTALPDPSEILATNIQCRRLPLFHLHPLLNHWDAAIW